MKLKKIILNKIGYNRLANFLCGAWIASLFSPFGWFGIIYGSVLAITLAMVNEQYFDKIFRFSDVGFTFAGCLMSGLLFMLIRLIILF